MIAAIERAVLGWLRRVAPRDWPDTMEGDLNEERERAARRLWTILQLSRIALLFTIEAAAAAWRRRLQQGRKPMTIGTDIRHAARALFRSPGFSLVAITTLAIAIGANTAIYSALHALVLQPLPFKDGNRYVIVLHKSPDMAGVMIRPSPPAIEQWRRVTHIVDRVESYQTQSLLLTGTAEPEEIVVSFLSSSSLATFGIAPIEGRPFVQADHEPSAPPVALVGYAFWQSRFGGDPNITGRTIALGGTTYTIVGVMPRRFRLPVGSTDLWAARRPGMAFDTDTEHTIAMLAPGVTIEQAQSAMHALPDVEGYKGWRGVLMKPSDYSGTATKTALFVLSGAVGLLLMIACVNVANLMLARHSGRRREIAVRHALGASRARIARYLAVETGLLAFAGGAAGLLVARASLGAMAALRPRGLEALDRLRLDPSALWFAAIVTLLTGLVFGAGPALAASRANLQEILKSGGRSSTGSAERVRMVLTVAQVAIALVLLVGASLLLKSYTKLMAVEPGYEPSGVLSIRLSLPPSRYPMKDPARRRAFFESLLASVERLPGVRAAAIGNGVPPETGLTSGQLEVEGRKVEGAGQSIFGGGYVTPAYFATLGIPILEGRPFASTDVQGRELVVIVNQTFARKYFADAGALGQRIRTGASAPWMTIVGIAGDVKALGLTTTTGDLQIYQPRAQTRAGFGAVIVKADGNPRALVPAIKQQIWALDPLLPMREVATADQLLSRSMARHRFNLAMLGVLAGCGLVLAIVGVYGVTAIFVGQRQREVGIRMALGATRAAVAALVVRQTMMMLGVALVIGIGGALWLSRYLQSLVFQTPTRDVMSFAAAAMGIVVAAFAATIIPLRRATSVDPAVVLRAE